jgi:hypothetical protein
VDDLVVDVGDVHDVADGDTEQLEGAAEDVYLQESTEVADVAVVIDGRPAGVHAQNLAVHGKDFVDLAGKGIKEAERHGFLVELVWMKSVVTGPFDCSKTKGRGQGSGIREQETVSKTGRAANRWSVLDLFGVR